MTKIRLEAVFVEDAGMFRWFDVLETVDRFVEEIGWYLNENTNYWRPSSTTRTRDGGDFFFPNGNLVSVEWHTGKWYLETEDELYPLTTTDDPQKMAQEIDNLIKSNGIDTELTRDDLAFNQMKEMQQ